LLNENDTIESTVMEEKFKALASDKGLKPGDVMLPFRIMLVGGKFGPHVFDIAALLGKNETIKRIEAGVGAFSS
jgi:glutamyl-tRNA synthetase